MSEQAEEHLVIFRLAGETYGVNIASVREIIAYQPVTRVPRAPSFVEGVINLRGGIIPVIDLRRRFRLPEGERNRDTRIVVVELAGQVVGLVVDGVSEVVRIAADHIEPPADVFAGVETAYLRGVARSGDRLVVLLDLDRLLLRQEQAALTETVTAGDGGGRP